MTATATLKEWQQQFKNSSIQGPASIADRRSRSDLYPEQSHLMSICEAIKSKKENNTGGWGVVNTVDPRLCSRVSVEYVKFLIPEVHP